MTRTAGRTLILAAALAMIASTVALAAGALKGKTYEGATPSIGIDSYGHHKLHLYAGGKIVLKVSRNGSFVTVHFTTDNPVLYCNTQETLHVQSTKSVRISRSGKFRASIAQRFRAGPGPSAIVQVITGRFSGRTVKGTIHTEAAECGGVSSFTAKAR